MYRLNEQQQRVVADAAAVADATIKPQAAQVDADAAFPRQSIAALGERGLLGLTIPAGLRRPRPRPADDGRDRRHRGAAVPVDRDGLPDAPVRRRLLRGGPGTEPSTCFVRRPRGGISPRWRSARRDRAAISGRRSAARQEAGAGAVHVNASKSFVTSAGHADGYVVSTLAAGATTPIESTIYFVLSGDAGVSVAGAWRGLGMRGNASAPMTLADVELGADRALTAPGKGLDMMLGVVLPAFQVGTAAVAVGIAEAAVQATIGHVTQTRLEHMNSSLAELPTLRAQIARMRIETDRARAHLGAVLDSLETPGPATQLMVLEAKAAATEAAVTVTDLAMRTCGGAAFGGAHGIERMFRDARAPIVMAPTSDQAYDFIGRALCGLEVF